MGEFYSSWEASNIQRGVGASVARYAGMGEFYAAATR